VSGCLRVGYPDRASDTAYEPGCEPGAAPGRNGEPVTAVATDEATLVAEMQRCVPDLRRYARFLLKSTQDADDLVHDCLVRALDRAHTRREELKLRPWLFAIMHNLFISNVRRQRTRNEIATADDMTDTLGSADGAQEGALRWRDLNRALAMLPEEQRTVLMLVSVEDLSYAEAGQVLGIPIGTVMSRLSRARERLRRIMEGEERPGLERTTLRRVK
jgi:RNA polymerase sigma-70 factor, ECF subfamily